MDENRVSVPADPGGAMLFVFSMEVISFWAVYLDVFSEGTYLVLGCLMLAVYPVYLISAMMLIWAIVTSFLALFSEEFLV